jgi:hypothetical protein
MYFLLSPSSRYCPLQGECHSRPLALANTSGIPTKCVYYSLATLQVLTSVFLGGILRLIAATLVVHVIVAHKYELHAQNIMSASQLLTLHQKNILSLLLG